MRCGAYAAIRTFCDAIPQRSMVALAVSMLTAYVIGLQKSAGYILLLRLAYDGPSHIISES